jgi:peroxiredoxin family protein/TusA-related sulfurtransferase/rhodanese-related sulfurtransferase
MIIGAQAFGFDGVDKRIDVISTAIMGGMTIDDLGHLELCYSPPFGVARDIVNTAGFLGRNTRLSLAKGVSKLEPKYTVIDVRDRLVASNSPIEGALNIPVAELRTSKEIPESRAIAAVCSLGKSSYFASRILQQRGFDAVSLLGGLAIHPELHPHHQASVAHSNVATAAPISAAPKEAYLLDACGIACPGPLMKLRETMPKLEPGQELRVTATDPGFARDFKAFCEAAGMEFLNVTQSKGVLTATLRKPGQVGSQAPPTGTGVPAQTSSENPHDVSIVVFSGDMDKVLAAFIIANGAVAMGGKATMFFTFWGLSALHNNHHASEKKSLVDSMMNIMLPHGVGQLRLSHLNIAGIGAQMMRYTMKKKGLPDLNQLVNDSLKNPNVRIVACTMSMTALGIEQSQLVDGIDFGGVAEFLAASSKSKSSLFI